MSRILLAPMEGLADWLLRDVLTQAGGYVLLISVLTFTLLYTPCVAAITSVKRELGTTWAIWVVIFQCVVAWIVSFIVHTIGMLL